MACQKWTIRNKMSDEEIQDRVFSLRQLGVFVEPLTRPFDINSEPLDGNEFIHLQKLQTKNCIENLVNISSQPDHPKENQEKHMRNQARKEAKVFSFYALKLESANAFFKIKFPKNVEFPENGPNSVIEWCIFCLGSKLCSKIYDSVYKEKIKGHCPFLSIIVHFDEDTTLNVLNLFREWLLILGMAEPLGIWMFAVLSIVKKPLSPCMQELLNTLYNDCEERAKHCHNELEKSWLFRIAAILEIYFCVTSEKIGPPLQSFKTSN